MLSFRSISTFGFALAATLAAPAFGAADGAVSAQPQPAAPAPAVAPAPPTSPASTSPPAPPTPIIAAPAAPEALFPANVRIVLGLEADKLLYPPRIQAANRLRDGMQADVQAALLQFLHKAPAAEPTLALAELNTLKNDVANALVQQSNPLPQLEKELEAMYRDPATDATWRDFCIQFLGTRGTLTQDAKTRKAILNVLREAVCDRREMLAGTALLALQRNIGADMELKKNVADWAVKLAQDAEASKYSRTTALQVAAGMGCKEVLPLARSLAADDGAFVPLRISATAAVGMLGDGSDRALLEGLASGKEPRLHVAAKAALKRINGAGAAPAANAGGKANNKR